MVGGELSWEQYQHILTVISQEYGTIEPEAERRVEKAINEQWETNEDFRKLFQRQDRPPTVRELLPILIWLKEAGELQ